MMLAYKALLVRRTSSAPLCLSFYSAHSYCCGKHVFVLLSCPNHSIRTIRHNPGAPAWVCSRY